ncbi:MAG: aspartate kinase [Polyangiaceae bacterium]
MAIVVQKYGGSSVADVEKLGLVADRVVAARRAGHDVVVVVSAMGKTTDGLLELARRAVSSAGAATSTDPPRRELDMLVSTGERVSMALLSIAIHARGHDAISFTGSQSGILTNDRHFDARIIEVRPFRIQDELARGRIVIVAGYQGMSYRREITTLGRGGSDTTAVALAAALGAERCEIYSDVDGVYTADPRVVPDAKHLPELDLAVLAEMAEAGAKVLNAQAVAWARREKIAIFARRTADGEGGRETVASAGPTAQVRAVVGMDRVACITAPRDALEALVREAAERDAPLLDVAVGPDAVRAVIPLTSLPDWDRCKAALSAIEGVTCSPERAVVSVVGDSLTTSARALPRMLEVLAREGVPVETLAGGPLRVAAVVDPTRLADATRALHAAFVT